jgi:hypothetical protein
LAPNKLLILNLLLMARLRRQHCCRKFKPENFKLKLKMSNLKPRGPGPQKYIEAQTERRTPVVASQSCNWMGWVKRVQQR